VDIMRRMQIIAFHKLRTGLQCNAPPAEPVARAERAGYLRDLLTGVGMFTTIEVEPTDDEDRLLAGLCSYRPSLTEEDVAGALERLWLDWLCYPFWEAHSLFVDRGHVELEAASRESVLGHYVTVHLVCQRSPVPGQRVSPEEPPRGCG
jgi:hypothetical protein